MTDLNQRCADLPCHTGWYLKALRTGATAHRHGHVVAPSASTRQIAMLMAALQAVHAGQLALEQPVTTQATDQHNDAGCVQYLQPGFTLPVRDVRVMMLIVSDNTCTGTVVAMVGLDAMTALSQAVGMQGTTHRDGIPPAGLAGYRPAPETHATTPADVGRRLQRILQGAQDAAVAAPLGSTPALCPLALDILSWQRLRNRRPARVPLGTKVAQKAGTTARHYHDAGMIDQGDRPLFRLRAYTDEGPLDLPDGTPGHTAAHHLIAQMRRRCDDAWRVEGRHTVVAPPAGRGESTSPLAYDWCVRGSCPRI